MLFITLWRYNLTQHYIVLYTWRMYTLMYHRAKAIYIRRAFYSGIKMTHIDGTISRHGGCKEICDLRKIPRSRVTNWRLFLKIKKYKCKHMQLHSFIFQFYFPRENMREGNWGFDEKEVKTFWCICYLNYTENLQICSFAGTKMNLSPHV